MTSALDILNTVPRAAALAMIEPLVERSPWVAAAIVDQRPFADDEALAGALVETITRADSGSQIALFNVHPELAGHEAAEGRMTEASTSEQGRLRLLSLSAADAARLTRMNTAYRTRFGHPFIVALHRVPDLQTLFATFERRLAATPPGEHTATLAEIASVIRSRAARAFGAGTNTPPNLAATTLE
ncbi:2-oxo-4-hydroxy-4-carboxy-5-ureidoimidazoline decarboxylase [Chelativorans xinjiangense]|uniref:2-oxo-4-hydroxy-4-carboxy-5-ureidoimidazoline decarboxylase n=1 Tax=Chelativorans xinjiangense TaxID=2681485 RepID=UPI00135AABB2|nr:2-oxo-4-hydroxy-4-carboxy-5-ureidoimidazoline decarboxylase [Chelativorans xinjiangense]